MGFAWLPDSGLTRVSIGSLRRPVTNQAGGATNRPTFPKAWATNEFVESVGCVSVFLRNASLELMAMAKMRYAESANASYVLLFLSPRQSPQRTNRVTF